MNINTSIKKLSVWRLGGVRLALVFGALFVIPFVAYTGSASAFPCGGGQLCVWHEKNAGGDSTYWGGTWRNTCWNMIPSWDNVISSVQNNMPVRVTFYDSKDCKAGASAWQFSVDPGRGYSAGDSGPFDWWMDNQISSVYFH